MGRCGICDKYGSCLDHLNKQYSEEEQETAWQETKRLAQWDNPNFPTKEIWFNKTNEDMQNQQLSYGGNILWMTYKAILTNVTGGYYKGSNDDS